MKKKKRRFRTAAVILAVLFSITLGAAGIGYRAKQIEGRLSDRFDRITISAGKDMKTQRGISWFTQQDTEFGNDLQVVKADKKSFFWAKTYHAKAFLTASGNISHQAQAAGLEPDTRYRYRVGDADAGEFCSPGEFTTAGEGGNSTFLAVSDTQITTSQGYLFAADTMRQGISHGSMDIIINAGDIVDDGGDYRQWSGLLNFASDLFKNYTFAGVAGNHIPDAKPFLEHFALPNETPDINADGVNYSFDQGSAHFIMLDTNENGTFSDTVSDEQIRWLREDVKKAAAGKTIWNIVCLHKGPYTIGPHAPQKEIAGANGSREKLTQVFDELGISLVIQGHDHIPSCTYPLTENSIAEDGVVYLEMGAAGEKTYTLNPELSQEYLSLFAYYDAKERDTETYHNYAVISVDDSHISLEMYEYAFGKETMLYKTEIQ